MQPDRRNRSIPTKTALALLGCILLTFLYISIFNEPIADDYAYAVRLHERSFWQAYTHEYFAWNGRYTSNLLVLCTPWIIASKTLAHLIPMITITGLTAAVYFFLRAPILQITRKTAVLSALVLMVIWLGSMARISEVIYWFAGAVSYTWPLIFSAFAGGALLRFRKKPRLWGFIAAISIFISSGCSEIAMAVNLLFAVSYSLYQYTNHPSTQHDPLQPSRPKAWLPISIAIVPALLSVLIVYFAPGNYVRAANFTGHNHQFWYSIGMSLLQTIRFTALTFLFIPLWIATTFIWRSLNTPPLDSHPADPSLPQNPTPQPKTTGTPQHISKDNPHQSITAQFSCLRRQAIFHYPFSIKNKVTKNLLNPIIYLLFACTPLFIASFLPYFATGILGQHRTISFGQFYLVAAILLSPFYFRHYLPSHFLSIKRRLQPIPKTVLLLIFVTAMTFQGNFAHLLTDLYRGRLHQHRAQMQHREAVIRAATTDTLITFPPLDTTFLFVIDIDTDPKHWINKHQGEVLNREVNVGIAREE